MRKDHYSIFDYHISYATNYIIKHFKLKIPNYNGFMCEHFEISYYLYPPINKDEDFDHIKWMASKKHLREKLTHKDIKDKLTTDMYEDLKDK